MTNKNAEISERITEMLDFLSVNANEFAKKLDYSRSQTIYDILNGKSLPSFDFFNRFLNSEYSELVSIDWIITGRGKMLEKRESDTNSLIVHEKQPTHGYPDQAIPVFDLTASASIQQIFSNQTKIVPMDHIRIPNIPKCDGAIYITGDSMYPLLKSGDMILYKEVQSKDNIIWGEMYVMYINNDGDEFFFVKYLQKSVKEGYVKLVSENVHHQAVDFPIDSIKHLAKVQASIRINSQV